MHDIKSYSLYIQDLVNQEKYENALIQFDETHGRFSATEIAQSSYLVKSLLKAYKKAERPIDGLEFIDKFSVDIVAFDDKYAISSYGWLLYAALKSSHDLLINESEKLVKRVMDFLPAINIKEGFNTRLFQLLFQQIIKLERKKTPPQVDRVFQILKAINIREIEEAKELVKDDPYLVSGILTILRKSNQLGRAFSFLNFLQIKINEDTAPQIIDAYGWMVYDKVKSENQDVNEELPDESFDSLIYDLDHEHNAISSQENRSDTMQLVLETIPWIDPQSAYGAFSRLFRLVLKSEKQRPNTNWKFLSDLLSLINPDSLSKECEIVTFNRGGKEQKMELASDEESWYAASAQVLLELGDYEQCVLLSNESLSKFSKLHYDNDVWFKYKIAKCQKGLGNLTEAIPKMEEVERRRSEWFVQRELAELYFEQGELSKAKRMAIKSALNYGDKEKKEGVYFLLGQIHKKQDQIETAYKHFLLSQMIRQEEDWKIPQRLKVELEETKPRGFKNEYDSSSTLFKELWKLWKGNSLSIQRQHRKRKPSAKEIQGKISHVRHDKGFGFIVGDNEHEYFFRSNAVKTDFGDLQKGLKVKFKYRPPKVSGEDKKWNAYDIVVLR